MSQFAGHTNGGIITDGLVFNVDGSNRISSVSGSTTVYELVDHVSGVASSSSIAIGESLLFDGVSDTVNYGALLNDIDKDSEFTIDVWIKPATTGVEIILGKGYWGQTFIIAQVGTRFRMGFYSNVSSSKVALVQTAPYTVGEWYNIIFTKSPNSVDVSAITMYINGDEDTGLLVGNSIGADDISTTAPIIMGRRTADALFFEGEIGPTKIYNRELTVEERIYNYDSTKYRYI